MKQKLFFRYFFPILFLSITVVATIVGAIGLRYVIGKAAWMNQAFKGFAESLELSMNSEQVNDDLASVLQQAINTVNDDRICGYIIYDSNNHILLTNGNTRKGLPLPKPQISEKVSYDKRNSVNLNLTKINGTLKAELSEIEKTEVSGPAVIGFSPKDVIGTINLLVDGKEICKIDILTYTPETYRLTKEIVKPILFALSVSLLVCLLLALLGAWLISSKNAKDVNKIREALNKLSNGEEDISIGNFKSSEFRDIAKAVQSLDRNLQANTRTRKAWLSSISHDLNSPVMAMKVLLDGMNDGIFKPNKTNIRAVIDENNSLARKIEKIIDFATLESVSEPKLSTIDSQAFMSSLGEIFPQLEAKTSVIELVCDTELMRKACAELLENAYEFGEKDAVVSLSLEENEGCYQIEIRNKGKLPSEDTEVLFDPFTKGNKARGFKGNGLGLSITGSIIKIHRGTACLLQEGDFVVARLRWTRQAL